MLWNYKNFSEDEFKCSCPCGGVDMDPDFMIRMVRLRMALDAPVIISSGWRCVSHNADVGGVKGVPYSWEDYLKQVEEHVTKSHAKKRYTITRKRFAEWMFSDHEDIQYWGNRFIQDLIEHNQISYTLDDLYDERDSLPAWLVDEDSEEDEISTLDIELID